MTLAKNQIKREAFNEIGNRLDDVLDGIKEATLKAEGAAIAVGGIAPKIQALHEHVNKDVDEGVITDLSVAKLVKTYITRAIDICEESAKQAQEVKIKLGSKADGISASIFEVKKLYDKEESAIQQAIFLSKCAEGGTEEQVLDPVNVKHKRRVGERPQPSIKARRQAEELTENLEETQEPEKAEPEKVVQKEEKEKETQPAPLSTPTPPSDPLQEIRDAQQASVRVDGRYQCGSCKRHFKSWDDLMEHCTLDNHTPRSPE